MAIREGDIIDEFKRYPDSCGLVVKVMGGGEGFEQIQCCDHALTEEDLVPQVGSPRRRKKGELPLAVVLDEKKLYPDSCGRRVMTMDGGAGFHEIVCCGHSLTISSIRDLKYGQRRDVMAASDPGPYGTASRR